MNTRSRPNTYRPRTTTRNKIADIDVESETRSRTRHTKSKFSRLIYLHCWVAVSTLGLLSRTPYSSLLTAAVMAIALSLPVGLFVLLDNVRGLVSTWENTHQISVYLKSDVNEEEAHSLAKRIQTWQEVERIEFISSDQALIEFRQFSGFAAAIDGLDHNPLPAVIIVQPEAKITEIRLIEALETRLKGLDQVDLAQLDMEWLSRLNAIIELIERGLILLTTLLGVAILLVVGNTIRLTIFSRREEILVSKLIGATNQFIRRPFLYCGFWYGLCGALLAWILVEILLTLLAGPVNTLVSLYGSQFHINSLDFLAIVSILLLGIGLGLLGSWLAVGRHLRAIEPR